MWEIGDWNHPQISGHFYSLASSLAYSKQQKYSSNAEMS